MFAAAALAVALCGAAVSLVAQGPRRDGNWEVQVEMSLPGMPQMPPMKMNQCVTKEDAADLTKTVPQGPQGRGGTTTNCKTVDQKIDGNKISFVMKCEPPPQASTMTGEMVYDGDVFTGTMKIDMDRGGQPMSMNMKYSGKRLGDCTK
jgi:hypothetical protein